MDKTHITQVMNLKYNGKLVPNSSSKASDWHKGNLLQPTGNLQHGHA